MLYEVITTANEIIDTEGVVAIPGARKLIDQIPEDQWTIVTSGSYDLVQARLLKAGLPRITSYNVCYTKLLRKKTAWII